MLEALAAERPWAAPRGEPGAAPFRAARIAARARPALFARWPVATPRLGLALGACMPYAAELAATTLAPLVVTLVFCAVEGLEAGQLDQAKAGRTAAALGHPGGGESCAVARGAQSMAVLTGWLVDAALVVRRLETAGQLGTRVP